MTRKVIGDGFPFMRRGRSIAALSRADAREYAAAGGRGIHERPRQNE
jgi:hypothetical protein